MVVQHNMQAMNANRMLNVTTSAQAKSTEKLSSGYKINRAADDAAGLSISEKMRKQMRGLDRASTNAQDGVSAVQTAEGALTEVHSMLQRMNELATQASNGTNSEADRKSIQDEIDQLTTEIDRVAETTKFNEIYLLKGNANGTSSDMKISAHDAGLEGKLTDNGSTATFRLDKKLEDGDKVKIAGNEYTIGGAGTGKGAGNILKLSEMNKSTDGYVDLGMAASFANVNTLGAGDSFTYDGEEYTLTDKITLDDIVWTDGDTFKIGEHYYSISTANLSNDTTNNGASSATPEHITLADAKKKLAEALASGDQVYGTKFATTKEDGTASNVTTQTQIVAEYGENEVRMTGLTDNMLLTLAKQATGDSTITAFKEGDKFTKDGETTTAVTKPVAAKDVYDAVMAVTAAGTTVTIGKAGDPNAKTYTIISDNEEEDAAAYKLHKDSILAMIHDGDVVKVGTGNEQTVIGDIGAPENDSAAKTISAKDAYAMMAEELQKASSIGTDEGKAAEVTNKGDGSFTIKKGSAEVKDGLSFSLHVGSDADMTNKIQVDVDAMSAAGLGIKGIKVDGNDVTNATYAIDAIADAISKVSAQRSALGAVQNRLEHTIANLDNVVENTTSAESRIRDTDMAEEMVEYSKNNILAQAGQSMLAQANQSNQGVLSLLG